MHWKAGIIMKKLLQRSEVWLFALFTLAYVYFECLFRVSTGGTLLSGSTLYMLLFALCWGLVGYLIATAINNKTVCTVLTAAQLLIAGVIFLVEYFTHRYFKVFYDVTTVIGGAAGVAADFRDVIAELIFCWDGFLKISAFLLPGLLYVFWLRRFACCGKLGMKKRLIVLGMTLAAYGLNLLLLLGNATYAPMYHKEYNFQAAVSNFGLLTGIRLDVQELLFGKEKNAGFELEEFPTFPTVPSIPKPTDETTPDPTETTVEETQPIEYGYNQMELNYPITGVPYIDGINAYVQAMAPSKQNAYTGLFEGKNLIFITAEAFTAEVIDPELTPTLYRLANKGIQFTDFYQPNSAGTTGGEYQNLFGMLPTAGGMSFKATAQHNNYFTMGSQLDRLGYWGKTYHNNDYTFYDRHLTHTNLGYSEGFMGYGNGMEYFLTNQYPTSDLEMFMATIPEYIDQQPFNVYYMTFSGHSNYFANCHAQVAQHYHRTEHLEQYPKVVRSYLAAQLELEDTMTYLLEQLDAAGILNDTVICMTGDHFPYGLDDDGALGSLPNLSALYGHTVTTALDRDHNALILWSGCLEEMDPIVVTSPTSSLDILPTLSNLFGTEYDSRLLPGRDVLSDTAALVFAMNYDWKTDYGTYYAASGQFVPADPEQALAEGYVDTVSAIVRNKIRYCDGVLDTDYFRYLFAEE